MRDVLLHIPAQHTTLPNGSVEGNSKNHCAKLLLQQVWEMGGVAVNLYCFSESELNIYIIEQTPIKYLACELL